MDWQCCLAGSSITALRILFFSIVLAAEYLSYVKFIATYALTFLGYIISVLASVGCDSHYSCPVFQSWGAEFTIHKSRT